MKDSKIHGDVILHLARKKKNLCSMKILVENKFSSMKILAKILLAICN